MPDKPRRGRPKADGPMPTIDIIHASIRRRELPESIRIYENEQGAKLRAEVKSGARKWEDLDSTEKVLYRRTGYAVASIKRRLARNRVKLQALTGVDGPSPIEAKKPTKTET
jgi:hypothetical protein